MPQPTPTRQSLRSSSNPELRDPSQRRQSRPQAIAWLLQHPKLPDSQIVKLIGTTRKMIGSIRIEATEYRQRSSSRPGLVGSLHPARPQRRAEKHRAGVRTTACRNRPRPARASGAARTLNYETLLNDPPSSVNSSTNSGKEVSIVPVPETVTDLCAAMPSTRKAIAMR